MAGVDFWILGAASGVCLALLGALVIALSRRRAQGALLGAFLVAWGVDLAFTYLATVVHAERAAVTLFATGAALRFFEVFTLGCFVASYAIPHRYHAPSWWVVVVGTAATTALFVRDPSRFLAGVYPDPRDGTWGIQFTTLSVVVQIVPFFLLLFAAALLALWRAFHDAPPVTSREMTLVGASFAILGAYVSARYVTVYGIGFTTFSALEGSAQDTLYVALFGAGALLFLAAAIALLVASRGDAQARAMRASAAAILGALLLGFVAAAPLAFGRSDINLTWLVRAVSIALVVYGILKFQIFDIDLRLKVALTRSTLAGGIVAAYFVGSELVSGIVQNRTGSILAGIVVAGAFLMLESRVLHLARRTVDRLMPRVRNDEAYRERRRRDVYQAALEAASRDGSISTRERAVLERLRVELALAHAEADAIERGADATSFTAT